LRFGTWRRVLLTIVPLTLSGCEIPDSALLPGPHSQGQPPRESGQGYLARTSSIIPPTAATASKTTLLEGTGRFIGTPPTAVHSDETSSEAGGITLNLVNVPTAQAAKTILGDLLGVRYTIDPNVKGEITVQTPKPASKAEIVGIFQSALRANNATVVQAHGHFRIVTLDQANIGVALDLGDAPKGRLGSGLRVVELKYIAASEMQRILEPIAPHGSIVRADDARHILTLSGTDQEISTILDAVRLFDIDMMKGMSFALVPVKSSQPTAIAEELRTVFASDGEGSAAGKVRFMPNNRLKAVLVITSQRQYLSRAESWIKRLDAQAEGTEKQFYTYAVQNRRADELVAALQAMFSNEAGSRNTTRNVAPPYQEATAQSAPLQSASQPSSVGFSRASMGATGSVGTSARPMPSSAASRPPSSPSSPALLGGDESGGEPRIRLATDGPKNAILIEAAPADYRRIMKVISALDVMPNQVMIETTIAEVTLNDDLQMGVRWYFQNKHNNAIFTDAADGAVGSVFPGFSYALTAANIKVTLNALSQITNVNVVSSPSLTVMDNSTAMLQIGDQVPITTQSAASVLTPGAPIVNSVSYKDTGVILTITPRINESGRVLLEIEQEVSSVATTTSSTIDSPTIKQRRVKTSVVVNNGEALTLGGMIQENKTVGGTQIPILGEIPILGNAFKQKDNSIAKTELIIIITPRVIRNLEEARRVTETYREEFERQVRADRNPRHNLERDARRLLE
jgi:general secretion pathway protein D